MDLDLLLGPRLPVDHHLDLDLSYCQDRSPLRNYLHHDYIFPFQEVEWAFPRVEEWASRSVLASPRT